MTKLPHLQWHFGLISWRKATLTTAAHQAWKKDLNREKESPLLMSSESFLSIAEIKTIKCIQRLRDLILNFIFLLHCWWNYKGTISKKKTQLRKFICFNCLYCCNAGNQECWYGLLCFIQWKTEQGNAPQVKYSAISPLLMITWWYFFFPPLLLFFFLIFHWFISSSLSEKSGIFVTTLISLFSPQTLQSLLWHVLIHRHNWVKPQEYGKSEIYTETRELTFHLQSCLNFQIYWTVFSIDLEITAADSAGKSHGFCGGKCL